MRLLKNKYLFIIFGLSFLAIACEGTPEKARSVVDNLSSVQPIVAVSWQETLSFGAIFMIARSIQVAKSAAPSTPSLAVAKL